MAMEQEQNLEDKKELTEIKSDSASKLLSRQDEKIDRLEDIFEKRLSTNTTNLITVFGIFASIVTFLSIEIQIFKNICDPFRLLGFSLVILASLLSFIFILHLIASFWINEKAKEYPKSILVFIALLFIGGGTLFFIGRDEVLCKENYIFQRYGDDFNSRQIELENNLTRKLNDYQKQIDALQKQIQNPKQ
jgi:ABC-type multidrug transport system fused ATPase/permease subunit